MNLFVLHSRVTFFFTLTSLYPYLLITCSYVQFVLISYTQLTKTGVDLRLSLPFVHSANRAFVFVWYWEGWPQGSWRPPGWSWHSWIWGGILSAGPPDKQLSNLNIVKCDTRIEVARWARQCQDIQRSLKCVTEFFSRVWFQFSLLLIPPLLSPFFFL